MLSGESWQARKSRMHVRMASWRSLCLLLLSAIQRLVDHQRRMRVLILAHEQDHSPGQCEKTAEVRMYVLKLGTSHTQAESCL